jgi:hypothetical protein
MRRLLLIILVTTASTLAQRQQSELPFPNFAPGTQSAADREAINQSIYATVRVQQPGEGKTPAIKVDLLNTSTRTITAFWYTVTTEYSNGTKVTTGRAFDVLSGTISREMAGPGATFFDSGTLKPNEEFHDSVPAGAANDGSSPLSASVQVTALIFYDRTAIGATSQIQATLADRKAFGERLGTALLDLRSALADPAVQSLQSPTARAARLREVIGERMSENRRGRAAGEPDVKNEILNTFSVILRNGDPEAIERSLKYQEATRRALVEHSTLEVSRSGGDQLPLPPVAGALSVTMLPRNETEILTVKVRNISNKPITAFCVSVSWHYATANESGDGQCSDLALGLAQDNVPEIKRTGSELTFAPQEIQTLTFYPLKGPGGTSPIFATAEPSTVIFDDRTAVGDPPHVDDILKSRRIEAAKAERLLSSLRRVAADKEPRTAIEAELKEVDRQKAQHGLTHAEVQTQQYVESNLKQAQNMLILSREAFDKLLKMYAARADYMARHSVLATKGELQ